jgi:transcriptional regulator with GAF, ATPase, and Fis domain
VQRDADGTKLVRHRQRVLVYDGPDRGLEREVRTRRVTVGTAADNVLVLHDPTVSGHHCEITLREGEYFVRDRGSKNGTTVNGLRIVEAVLPPRARIRVGDTELRFEPKRKWVRVSASDDDRFGTMLGVSPAMRTVFGFLERVAETDLSCVVLGETGTGKELAARAVHDAGDRGAGPFVVFDCASVSAELVSSELFGHVRGAFTGAETSRAGAIELAGGGTLFLDEIGELPLELQPMLLRVLQEHEVKRVGAASPVPVDIRVVAATHRDLPHLVDEGAFREDLYYRLAEVTVYLPALRERPEDVPLLAVQFVRELADASGAALSLDTEAVALLAARDWPGNVRELRNVVRRASLDARAGVIGAPAVLAAVDEAMRAPKRPGAIVDDSVSLATAREQWSSSLEREYLERVLAACDGDIDRAATRAEMHVKSFQRLLRRHGVSYGRR